MEEKERKQLKKRLLGLVINEPPYPYPITMAEVMVNDMSKPNLEPLLNFIEKELDRAREEGYQNCMDDIWEEARGLRSWTEHDGSISSADVEAGLQEAYLNIENKLKTKEDGK